MRINLRTLLAGATLGSTVACASPIHVVQLETLDSQARGVRYMLKRPSYAVGLQYRDPGKNVNGTKKPEECRFDLVVVTKMDQRRTYEVRRPPWYVLPLHPLSNTRVSVVLDDDGALASAALNHEDHALEFVQAVAALAVKAVGVEAAPPAMPAGYLPAETAKRMDAYLVRKSALKDELAALRRARSVLLAYLAGGDPKRPTPALEGIADVDARLEAVGKQLAAHYLPVPERDFRLHLGDDVLAGRRGNDAGDAPLQVPLSPVTLVPPKEDAS